MMLIRSGLVALLMLTGFGLAQEPPVLTTLHNFSPPYSFPTNVVVGSDGVLYGTTQSNVFSLTRTASGTWGLQSLYSDTAETPVGSAILTMGANRVLYGAEENAIYSLTPPATEGGSWTYTPLYQLDVNISLTGGLVMDANAVLYGITNAGTLFSLTPPTSNGGSWIETTLYTFPDGAFPWGTLALGTGGEIFGATTSGGTRNLGTVFELTPTASGGPWTLTTLHSFIGGFDDGWSPQTGVVIGSGGVLYGTTRAGGLDYGTVFSLAPPETSGGDWKETVIYRFQGGENDGAYPGAGVAIGDHEVLYGSTLSGGVMSTSCNQGCGTLFSLARNGAGGAWVETVLHSFAGPPSEGNSPSSTLAIGKSGILYGATSTGGTGECKNTYGCGTVFELDK